MQVRAISIYNIYFYIYSSRNILFISLNKSSGIKYLIVLFTRGSCDFLLYLFNINLIQCDRAI